MANGSDGKTAQVYERTEMIELTKKIGDEIVALELKKLAPKEGKSSPVLFNVTPIVEVAGSRIPLGRSFQVLFRVRPPQVQGEDKKWTDDPNFPAKLKEADVLKEISAVLVSHIAK